MTGNYKKIHKKCKTKIYKNVLSLLSERNSTSNSYFLFHISFSLHHNTTIVLDQFVLK